MSAKSERSRDDVPGRTAQWERLRDAVVVAGAGPHWRHGYDVVPRGPSAV